MDAMIPPATSNSPGNTKGARIYFFINSSSLNHRRPEPGLYSMPYAPVAIRMTGTIKSRQVSRNCFPKILSRVWASGIQERMKEPAVENGEVQVMTLQ